MATTVTTHMDNLAQHIADLQSKTEALFHHPLPSINSDVYAASTGDCNDLRGLVGDVWKLLPDLSELCASAEGAVEAHAGLIKELERLASSEEDTLDGADVTAADGAGMGGEPSGAALTSAHVIAGTH